MDGILPAAFSARGASLVKKPVLDPVEYDCRLVTNAAFWGKAAAGIPE